MDMLIVLAPVIITNLTYAVSPKHAKSSTVNSSVMLIAWNLIHFAYGFFLHHIMTTKPKHYAVILTIGLLNLFINSTWTAMASDRPQLGFGLTWYLLLSTVGIQGLFMNDIVARLLLVPYATWLVYALQLQSMKLKASA